LTSGFEAFTGNQLAAFGDHLESQATISGFAAPLFLAQAIRAVDYLFREQDECGGIRIGFIRELDRIALVRLSTVNEEDWRSFDQQTRQFRDDVLASVSRYDPTNTYE
jgi:hypothetical protein